MKTKPIKLSKKEEEELKRSAMKNLEGPLKKDPQKDHQIKSPVFPKSIPEMLNEEEKPPKKIDTGI